MSRWKTRKMPSKKSRQKSLKPEQVKEVEPSSWIGELPPLGPAFDHWLEDHTRQLKLAARQGDVESVDELLDIMKYPCTVPHHPENRDLTASVCEKVAAKIRSVKDYAATDDISDMMNAAALNLDETLAKGWREYKSKFAGPFSEFEQVDLKFGLWTPDREGWEEYGYGKVWDNMEAAFAGEAPPIEIRTAPRKEIQYGAVTISKGSAEYEFHTIWDSPNGQVPEDIDEKDYDRAVDIITDYFANGNGYQDWDPESPIGAQVSGTVKARSFNRLMSKIDDANDELLGQDNEASEAFDEMLKSLPQYIHDNPE